MTMEIKITLDPKSETPMNEQLEASMDALGFTTLVPKGLRLATEEELADDDWHNQNPPKLYSVNEEIVDDKGPAQVFPRETPLHHDRPRDLPADTEKPKRVRRTKAQIAADEEAAGLASQQKIQESIASGRIVVVDDPHAGSLFGEPAISTGEPRIDPQDAADEARESAANKTGLTKDDVREAINRYRVRHGIVEAQADIPAILGCSIADLPDDAETLQAAITLVDEAALAKPSLKERDDAAAARKVDVKLKDAPAIATMENVKAELRQYADKYDGKGVGFNDAKNLLTDIPKVLQKVFGKDCVSITLIPSDGFGKAVAAIKEATDANPYKRAVAS